MTGRRWELHFDNIPPGPNDRLSQWERIRSTKEWRIYAGWNAKKENVPALARIRLSATIYRRNLGVADASNDAARFKAVEDGIVDAGVVPSDTRKYVEWGPVREAHGPAGFVLVIEELEPMTDKTSARLAVGREG